MSDEKPLILIKKDSPNRKTSKDLAKIAEDLGVNPFEVLLHFASDNYAALGYDSPVITVTDRLSAAKEAAQYLYAKKRSIEVHGDSDADPISIAYEGSILDLFNRARGKE